MHGMSEIANLNRPTGLIFIQSCITFHLLKTEGDSLSRHLSSILACKQCRIKHHRCPGANIALPPFEHAYYIILLLLFFIDGRAR